VIVGGALVFKSFIGPPLIPSGIRYQTVSDTRRYLSTPSGAR
jgi:hypothetical protein